MELNTREVAALIWVFVGVVWIALGAKKNGKSYGLMNVARTFFSKPVITVAMASIAWVCVCVVILSQLGAWSFDNLKATMIWFFGFAFVGLMNAPNNQGDTEGDYLISYLKKALGVSVFVGFLAGAYTLPIFLEFFILPVIFVFSAFIVMSKRKPEHKILHGPSNWVIAVIALIYIGYGVLSIALDPQVFFSWKKLSDLFLPMILSILFIPCVMFIRVLMIYHGVFNRISYWIQDVDLLRYAKKRSIATFDINIEALSFWCDSMAYQEGSIATKEDIERSIRDALANKMNEKVSYNVEVGHGWNPHRAKDYLKEKGLCCKHYKNKQNGWGADSNHPSVGSGQLSTTSYYVEGDQHTVKSLRLELFYWDGDDEILANDVFLDLCVFLVRKAIPEIDEDVVSKVNTLEEFNIVIGKWRINSHKTPFNATYRRTFEINIL